MAIDIRSLTPYIEVFDMPAALDFYGRILGFEVVQKAGPADDIGWAWLRRDGAEVMLNTAYELHERPAAPDPARVAAHRDTCLYLGCPDVDAAYEHLAAHGIATAPPQVAHYGMKQLYVRDPDGYNICLQWPVNS